MHIKKALVAGWFSFSEGHATAGDLLVKDVACEWLTSAGYSFDVALDPPFNGGVNWRLAEPTHYSHVLFVCGPFQPGKLEACFISRFEKCRLIGLNLTMPVAVERWNPFDFLLERDSSHVTRADMVFASKTPRVPIVGICLVESYPGALDAIANEAIRHLVSVNEIAAINIDTRLDYNTTNLRSAAEIESLIAKVDILITTRLHGAVMAIKHGVPVVPIDPEAGGAKIVKQMKELGWPFVFSADALSGDNIQKAFEYCLTAEAREKAKSCCIHALATIETTSQEFMKEMSGQGDLENNYLARLEDPTSSNWIQEKLVSADKIHRQQQRAKSGRLLKKILKLIAFWAFPTPILKWVRRKLLTK